MITNTDEGGFNVGNPVIPVVTQEQALTDLLESIALEEAALAHLINAEAEKVQNLAAVTGTDPQTAIDIQEAVRGVLTTAIKMQLLLQFKLEEVLSFKEQL